MNVNEKVQYWIEIAEYDLKTTKVMLDGKRFLYVGFMCHQVIEKILKAYYTFRLEEVPPFIHNLPELAKKSKLYLEFSKEQKDFIDQLDPLNIESRYPTYKNKLMKILTENKCKQILNDTEVLFQWIKKKLIEN